MTTPSLHEPLLVARGLTREFDSTEPPTRVLDVVDLTVQGGEYLVIMGASGSGKSTLLGCLSGMDRATDGEVIFEGADLSALTEQQLSRLRLTRMGFVFQHTQMLNNLSIRDNILLPSLKASHDANDVAAEQTAVNRVDALLERFGLESVADHSITEVSGGQLQRAGLCRALATEPALVFADEPTGALNSRLTLEVLDAFDDEHRRGTTLVMVTHDPVCAARAQRVVYLRDGSIVSSIDLGTWSSEQAQSREQRVLTWLGELEF